MPPPSNVRTLIPALSGFRINSTRDRLEFREMPQIGQDSIERTFSRTGRPYAVIQASQTACPQSSEYMGYSKRQQRQTMLLISPSFPCRNLHLFCIISSWCKLKAIWGSADTPRRPLRETFIPRSLNRFTTTLSIEFSKNKHRSRPS